VTDWRTMVVFENESGLPEDRFVNTWYFRDAGGYSREEAAVQIVQKIGGFYNGGSTPLSSFFSGKIARTANSAQVRVYNLQETEPRQPGIEEWTLGPGGSGADMPNEVAVALSFFSGRNLPRQRGRIYLGPLKAIVAGNRVGDMDVGQNLLGAVPLALDILQSVGQAMTWCVRSDVTGQMLPVTNVWCDDAFDTQRRRGKKPTTRREWVYPIVG